MNLAGMVGHNMLRTYGAAAMSTSLEFDEDRNKRPVPSRQADDAELGALLDVLARHRKFVQFIPAATGRQMRKDVQRMAGLTGPRGVVSTWIGVFHDQDHPDWARGMLDFAAQLRAQGVRNYPQVSPRTLDIHVTWDGGMSWFALEHSWHAMVQAPRPEKAPMLRDPRWRVLARQEWDRVPRTMIPAQAGTHGPGARVQRASHRHWLDVGHRQLAGHRELPVQHRHVPEDLVEYAMGRQP